LLGVSLALTSQAAFALTPGQKLSDAEIAQLGTLPMYEIGRVQYRVVPPEQADGTTLILNRQGVVGVTRNEISITGAPVQEIEARLGQTVPQPLSVQHFEPTNITVARYADFAQAVEGLQALKAALPEAKVRLSVQFGKQV